jgi:tellurite methyltransferase
MNDNKYWNSFYEKPHDLSPSFFAVFVKDRLEKDDMVLELGCGNGRDSLYLKGHCKELYAIDNSSVSINKLNETQQDNLHFVCCDISEVAKLPTPSVVYARFFLHSITEDQQQEVFKWLSTLDPSTLLLIECRSDRDKGDKHYGTDHYRRLINYKDLLLDLESIGYEIDSSVESQGLSPYCKEDPFLIRVVAHKNDI